MSAAAGIIGTEELLDAFERIGRWASEAYPRQFREAVDAFELMARPACIYDEHPAEDKVEATGAAFSEWWLFEAVIDDSGRTPLLAYAEDGGDERLRAIARDMADTQLFQQFAVLALVPDEDAAVMSGVSDHGLYRVHNEYAARSRNWRRGLLGCRIARIGGLWYMVSLLPLHDNGGDPSRPDPDGEHFLGLVRKVLGVDGEFAQSVYVRRED